MKVIVNAKELVTALKSCIVEKKTTIPVLTTVKFDSSGKLTSTDADFLKAAGSGEITIGVKDGNSSVLMTSTKEG